MIIANFTQSKSNPGKKLNPYLQQLIYAKADFEHRYLEDLDSPPNTDSGVV